MYQVQKPRKFFFLTPILLYDVCALAYFDLKIKLLTGELHSDEFHQFFCAVMIFVMMLYLLHKVYKIYRLIWWEKSCWKMWNVKSERTKIRQFASLCTAHCQSGTPDNIVNLCCYFYVYTFLRHYKVQTKKDRSNYFLKFH